MFSPFKKSSTPSDDLHCVPVAVAGPADATRCTRTPQRSWGRATAAVLAVCLLVGVVGVSPAAASNTSVSGLTLASSAPGELVITWDEPDRKPVDYRVSFAPQGEPFRTWTDTDWNSYPTTNSLTLTGLDEGVTYKVKTRARYGGSSGPWTDTASHAIAATPQLVEQSETTQTTTTTTTPPPQTVTTQTTTPPPPTQTTTTTTTTPPPPRSVTGLTLASSAPGELVITWNEPDRTPVDYRVSFAPQGEPFRTWTDTDWNSYPTTNSLTLTGLDEGVTYKVKTRARYGGSSGPWTDTASHAIAATPQLVEQSEPPPLEPPPVEESVSLLAEELVSLRAEELEPTVLVSNIDGFGVYNHAFDQFSTAEYHGHMRAMAQGFTTGDGDGFEVSSVRVIVEPHRCAHVAFRVTIWNATTEGSPDQEIHTLDGDIPECRSPYGWGTTIHREFRPDADGITLEANTKYFVAIVMESGSEDFDVGGLGYCPSGENGSCFTEEELEAYILTATGWTIDPSGPYFIQGLRGFIAPQASGLTWSHSQILPIAIAVEGTPVASDDEQ